MQKCWNSNESTINISQISGERIKMGGDRLDAVTDGNGCFFEQF